MCGQHQMVNTEIRLIIFFAILCSGQWRSSIQLAKRPGADCGSDYELVIAKFYHIHGITVGHNLATKQQQTILEYLYLPQLSCQLPGTSRLFFFLATLQGMWDPSSQPRNAPTIPAVEAQFFH